jgi:hypothetical protein
MVYLTADDVRKLLRAHIRDRYITQSAAAEAWGVSKTVVSDVLARHRSPSGVMLDDLGLERVILYRAKEDV